ncbi:TonB family protein [Sphingomonas sp.]|jgi:protein TonB|uniref:energy transducer TonB n=1 Tax=Sphingomonas sp. TaxID=28214 RepID=UPI002ED9877A
MGYSRIDPRSRALSAAGALAVQGLLILVLIQGLGGRIVPTATPAMQLLDFTLDPPPPEPEVQPKTEAAPREEGAAAPPNLVSRATEVAAPPTIVPVPPIMPVAPVAAQGSDTTSGAAPIAGPGTGAGGEGDGTGSGGSGDGTGGGGGTVLRLLRGDLYDSDYPDWAERDDISGTVYFRLRVGIDGRVSECRVTRSSGSTRLDQLTCRLIQRRFRYAPSRDARGRPYVDTVIGEQSWENYDRPEGSTDR